MANDSTVKAGSWGARTVEKIIRIIELARRRGIPIVYMVDSAGARITDQVDMFPGRRGAGKIFHNQVKASGSVPQVCCLFGPIAAGGAYIPAFCDVVFMVEKNASMYLGSPRMAEEVIGEKVTLEEMGGARMHCEVSGCGDLCVPDDKAAIEVARAYLSYFPQSFARRAAGGGGPARRVPGFAGGTGSAGRVEAVRHVCADRRRGGRGFVLRDQARLRARGRNRARPDGGARRRASSRTSRPSWAACCSWTPPTRSRGSCGCATRSTSRWSSWPTCPASWSAAPSSARASSGTARS